MIRVVLGHQNDVSIRRATGRNADISPCLDDSIERAPVHHQIFDHRKRLGAPRLEVQGVAILEMAHAELAYGGSSFRAMRDAIDHESARPADALAALVFERDGF